MTSPTKRPLPYNTQHSVETVFYASAGFGPEIPASETLQTHTLVCTVAGIRNMRGLIKEDVLVMKIDQKTSS